MQPGDNDQTSRRQALLQTPAVSIAPDEVARFILDAPEGKIVVIGGVDRVAVRTFLDQVEPESRTRLALLADPTPCATTEALIEQVVGFLAETARHLWPIWYSNAEFSICQNNSLGRKAAILIARETAHKIAGVSSVWAEQAVILALEGQAPRVAGALPSTEVAQLARAINPSGLAFVANIGKGTDYSANPEIIVRAMEWIAKHIGGPAIALFADLPANEPPFDRILYGARFVRADPIHITPDQADEEPVTVPAWIAPWRGLPHPLSDIERRLAKMLAADDELGQLFGFNQFISTVTGSRPKVDLLWSEGRLVVELDGYESHSNRRAFAQDRHRDYELALTGYTVLRLANEEIAQDCEKAIEKIRDIVRLRRGIISKEA